MKKIFLPVLIVFVVLGFAGTPAAHQRTQPLKVKRLSGSITIDNYSGRYVTRLIISSNVTGQVTIDNPSFPYSWNEPGSDVLIWGIFDGYYTGSVQVANTNYCQNYYSNDYFFINFPVTGGNYNVWVFDDISMCP